MLVIAYSLQFPMVELLSHLNHRYLLPLPIMALASCGFHISIVRKEGKKKED